MFMPRVRAFDDIRTGIHAEQNTSEVFQFQIVCVRAVPASPAQVIANLLGWYAPECMIESFHAYSATAQESIQPHRNSDSIPKRRQPRIVYLKDQTCGGDGAIFHCQSVRQRIQELFLGLVKLIAAINLQACRRRGSKKEIGCP